MAGDSFWGVVGDVANMAAQDIGRYQERKRELSEEHKAELRRQAVENARREQQDRAFGLDQQQFGETQRHNRAVESNQGMRAGNINPPNTLEAAYLRAREAGDMASANEFRGLLTSQDRFRGPEPKAPPNYMGLIPQRAEDIRGANALQRQRESSQLGEYGGRVYKEPTTDLLSDSTATEQAYRESSGQFPQYGIDPDSIRRGVELPTQAVVPQGGLRGMYPSHNLRPRQSMGLDRIGGLQPQQDWDSIGRQQFDDWDDLTPEEKNAVIQKMQRGN